MAEATALDALVAEMLGDIVKLHDAVDSLKEVLPAQTEVVEQRLTGLIGLLQKAGDVYREQIETYTTAQGEIIRAQMEQDANAAKQRFDRESSAAIRTALSEVERTVKSTIKTEIAAPVQEVLWSMHQSAWKNLAACLTCGLLGGAVAISTNAFITHDPRQEGFAELGKAVAASWDKLDNKAKAAIDEKRRQ